MKVVVVTVVSGRHDHLAAQIRGLAESTDRPVEHIVVAMGDDDIADVIARSGSAAKVLDMDAQTPLPVARARNLGAAAALGRGAELVVFLDVDCIPAPEMLDRYRRAALRPDSRRTLLCGPVTYLKPDSVGLEGDALIPLTAPHPARPNPPAGAVEPGHDFDLFWSLSFAVHADTWTEIGGFCEDYTGYGGEDTDFAATARASGIGLRWVGGAHAYHQFHPVSDPPVEHLDDIVVNARIFFRRWGRWPMVGWLEAFASLGLLEYGGTEIRRFTAAVHDTDDGVN
ncbi:galactosyltransferase-related protein [Rhodococcus fascians]|uniref:glycosyltransferase family 2 protein n=1 Tax=Rhodococcoides fascians TaxID=1828 RepID=UPI0024B99343|nr:galactosyltransferase-related protein [Rhodococcus fascians]MDJ0428781.1 galactosyltransferase-related protein [Rhodococcus fascians]